MNYIIIYLEVEHLLKFLNQSEKGDLFDILIEYTKNQNYPVIEKQNVLNVFNFLKSKLDQQIAKNKLKADTSRNNGTKGGRPTKNPAKPSKTQQNPAKPTGLIFQKPILEEIQSDFKKFWEKFLPVRVEGKFVSKGSLQQAEKAYQKQIKAGYTAQQISDGLENYSIYCETNGQLTCAATTFLNQRRFLDEYQAVDSHNFKNKKS